VLITASLVACSDESGPVLIEGQLIVGPDGSPAAASPGPALRLDGSVTAVGDSVMLAAIDQLEAAGMEVDAEVSRGVPAAVEVLRRIAERGQLGDRVLIHIGHNSMFTPDHVDEFMALAGGRPVTFLTVKVPLAWEQPNNQVMRDATARHPNLTVLEWEQLVAGRPELFWDDGVHLRPEGAAFYARFVLAALQ
jgi:hypothetical protein